MSLTYRIDGMRRVVLPHEVKRFGWGEGTQLTCTMLPGFLLLQEASERCRLCGSGTADLFPVGNAWLCRGCLLEAAELARLDFGLLLNHHKNTQKPPPGR